MKLTKNFNKIGTLVFLLAIIVPSCIPLFAIILFAFGHGTAEFFGGWIAYVFEGFAIISLVGFFIAYRKHKNIIPLVIGLESSGLIFYAYNFSSTIDVEVISVGMLWMLFAIGLNYFTISIVNTKIVCKTWTEIDGQNIELQSSITCPKMRTLKK